MLIYAAIFVPRTPVVKTVATETVRPSWKVYLFCLVYALFQMFNYTLLTNTSVIVERGKLGTSATAGVATALFMIGCMFGGVAYAYVVNIFKSWTIIFGIGLTIVGFVIGFVPHSIIPVFFANFMGGSAIGIVVPCTYNRVTSYGPEAAKSYSISMVIGFMGVFQFLQPYVYAPIMRAINSPTVGHKSFYISAVGLTIVAVLIRILWVTLKPYDRSGDKEVQEEVRTEVHA
jgi:MFS family permease